MVADCTIAMLQGPQNGDYFNNFSQGLPTPNESSLRTGLTPGGGGKLMLRSLW